MKRVRSYTNVWTLERVLYSIYHVPLPVPMTYTQIAWGLGSLGFSLIFQNFWFMQQISGLFKFLILPVFVGWFMSKKGFDGKHPHKFMMHVFLFWVRKKERISNRGVELKKQRFDIEYTTVERS